MTKRQGLWASLIIIGVALLPGCGRVGPLSVGSWQAYPGNKLPGKETALIKRGHGAHWSTIDGKWILNQNFGFHFWKRTSVRVLPGEHEMGGLTFEVEAGRVYTYFNAPGEEGNYVWLKDESGTVIAGEPPPD